ncbi:YceD family protein [Variovorax sp. PBL-E5]|uniref:YceD family protein n=1 Tax=Variovorax sp. PBL-E5 TaxID=434014 RepID=UPI001317A838|nr:hypothetical protein E5CHR_03991 [Variovorax sp. PBL-E5]
MIVRERFRLSPMTREFHPSRLDVDAFAETAATVSGEEPLASYPRLQAELAAPAPGSTVHWKATGACRGGSAGGTVPWLHLSAGARVPLICQRCLGPVDVDLQIDRWFRFAGDEAIAAAEDEASEEDVLVSSRDFDLRALVEDELLMEIPITPRHEVCPELIRFSAEDPDFNGEEGARPNPFAVLGTLRPRKPE